MYTQLAKVNQHQKAINLEGSPTLGQKIGSTPDPLKGSAYNLLSISAIFMRLQAMHEWLDI